MEIENFQTKGIIFRNTPTQIVILCLSIILISNLNAIVDHFLHPQIPYFDQEHLIVGGVTGLVCAVLLFSAMLYARKLEQALGKIRMLESFLPICSNCKKIRIEDSNPTDIDSWQSIELYISDHTTTKFSHSVCPDCMTKLYP